MAQKAGPDLEHLDLSNSTSSTSLSNTTKQGLRNWFEWTQGVHSPFDFYFYFYYVLLYFILLDLIFLFRFSLIFKLIFVLSCFSLFYNFSCINFCSLSENFEARMTIRKARKRERNFRSLSLVLPPDFVLSITFSSDIGFG